MGSDLRSALDNEEITSNIVEILQIGTSGLVKSGLFLGGSLICYSCVMIGLILKCRARDAECAERELIYVKQLLGKAWQEPGLKGVLDLIQITDRQSVSDDNLIQEESPSVPSDEEEPKFVAASDVSDDDCILEESPSVPSGEGAPMSVAESGLGVSADDWIQEDWSSVPSVGLDASMAVLDVSDDNWSQESPSVPSGGGAPMAAAASGSAATSAATEVKKVEDQEESDAWFSQERGR